MKTLTVLALLTLVAVPSSPVRARQDDDGAPSQRLARPRPLETVLQALTRSSGITVIAESSLAGAQAEYPREAATPQNLEVLLDKVAKSLPPGTVWKKAMLPASTRFYRGDDVAAFLEAQTRMLGKPAPRPGEPSSNKDTVEVLGQTLAPEKAAPVVSTLGLKPVYVLVNNASRRPESFFAGTNGQTDFFKNFMSMSPEARTAFMNQTFQMFQSLSPEQRNQLVGGGIRLGVPPPGGIPPK